MYFGRQNWVYLSECVTRLQFREGHKTKTTVLVWIREPSFLNYSDDQIYTFPAKEAVKTLQFEWAFDCVFIFPVPIFYADFQNAVSVAVCKQLIWITRKNPQGMVLGTTPLLECEGVSTWSIYVLRWVWKDSRNQGTTKTLNTYVQG